MPEAFAPAVGQRFAGRFELSALLRGSGPARVFTASEGSARPLVLVLLDPSACTPGAWAELTRVVTAATERGLPGVVPLRNVPAAPPDPLFFLADPPFGWSFDRLRQGGPPAWQKQAAPLWERALRLGERAAAILGTAHAALGVPHRALVPQRLVLTEADELVILDFGVGELEPSGGRPDDCGYRAPEQAKSRGDVRSDVFSLAAVLFELIAGERPSPRMPARLRSLVPGVPQAVDDLFAEALAVEPWQRYADMGELREALRDALGLGPAPALSLSAPVIGATPPAAEASTSESSQVDLSRSDLPILPGSPSAPAPVTAAPSLGRSTLGSPSPVAAPEVAAPTPVQSIVSAPPGGVAGPTPARPLVSTPGGATTMELPSPARSLVSTPPGGVTSPPTMELPSPGRSGGASSPPTMELPSPGRSGGATSPTTLELPSPERASVSSPPGGPAEPSPEPSPTPKPGRASVSATPPRGPLLPPLELSGSPSPGRASATPRRSFLPPVEPLATTPTPTPSPRAASVDPAASGSSKTEIDWTRPRPGTPAPASARPLRYSKLVQLDDEPTDVAEAESDPDRPPDGKTEILPESFAQAVAPAAKTEQLSQPFAQPPAAKTELVPRPMARLRAAGEDAPAARTEMFVAPASRAARTEIFVGGAAAAGRTEIFVAEEVTQAARAERTEMLPSAPSFAGPPSEPPPLERVPEARGAAATRSAPSPSASSSGRRPAPGPAAPAPSSGPSIKLLLITVNAVLLVVIVLVLALR